MTLPLNGIRVLEFTHAIMGPACGLVLADMGAEVIRIERAPDGDDTRRLKGFGTGYYTFFNRNKKSLAVNIKSDEGHNIICKLVESADVLIENFAPNTMERLGFGYEALSQINPRLIYCSLKGFMAGPYENRSALDEVVQMMSGLAYMTGPVGRPLRAGASVVDIMGGTYGALGVLVALRERDQTGKGAFVQNGLFETAAYMMGQHMAYAAIAREPIPPMPARVSAWAVYHTFDTADNQMVFVGITSDKHWQSFCAAANHDDWAADTRLSTNSGRIDAREWFLPMMQDFFKAMTRDEVIALCDRAAIPFAPIAHPEDLFDDPQLNSGAGLLETTLPDGTMTKLPRQPVALNDERWDLRMQPPSVGEHTCEVLRSLGYDEKSIDTMRALQIISEE
jgi:crotonobetainyl-CoA:carnitine CoA-transferase CaiB-like acyl-CoA transferase